MKNSYHSLFHRIWGIPKSKEGTPPYRFFTASLGILVCCLLVWLTFLGRNEPLTWSHLYSYLKGNPLFGGLVLIVPVSFYIGRLHEKLAAVSQENEDHLKEITIQNQLIHTEINLRDEREKELEDARQEALMGIKAKDQFLSNMSHEIRTPMNGIIGIVNLLKDTNLDEQQRNYLATIDYSSQTLLSLINQILDLSKINSEKLNLEYIDFDLHKVLYSIAPMFHGIIAEKGIILRTLVDPSVPKWTCGDPVRLNQILLNLVSNAIKFTEEGGVDIIVKASKNDDGPRLKIQVNDTGIGIPKEKHETIFETFAQASSETSRLYGGSGLGLSICKKLVELFGGTIRVESQIGKGTSFSFEIQLREAVNQKPEPLTKTETVEDQFNPQNFKILIAEDNKANQLVLQHTLKKRGFQTATVSNGQDVIEAIYKEKFDMILMDVQMPIMSGIDATRFIRNAIEAPMNNVKILAMTASVMKEDLDKCLEAGMDDYVPKPFLPQDLFLKLRNHLTGPLPEKI